MDPLGQGGVEQGARHHEEAGGGGAEGVRKGREGKGGERLDRGGEAVLPGVLDGASGGASFASFSTRIVTGARPSRSAT